MKSKRKYALVWIDYRGRLRVRVAKQSHHAFTLQEAMEFRCGNEEIYRFVRVC